MKRLQFLLICFSFVLTSNAQQYWQQRVDYTIDVALDDTAHSLDGFEKIIYTNHSPDTLRFIWFHLWPNAYKNDKTAFTDQSLENGSTAFYFSKEENRGYINRLDFKVNGKTASLEDHPQHIDIIKLLLPEPLIPGQTIQVTTPFHVKLPYNFSRGGHEGQSYQATQWYPKPAVYDKEGWHPMPYLDQGEFYSEFGNFEVNITVPANYVVAATGKMVDNNEKEWLRQRAYYNWEPVKTKEKSSSGQYKAVINNFPVSASTTKTLTFRQENVHDFAWFADKRFVVNHDTCMLASGRIIDVMTYYTPQQKKLWEKSVEYSKSAVHHYSALIGEYPYDIVQVVQGPESFGGGMEYPTITVIAPVSSAADLDDVIAHEIGHNWFYGILASNERKYPWMDEGINSYYDYRYTQKKRGTPPAIDRIAFESKAATKTDQPISLPADQYTVANYGLVVYYKTAEWMRYLEEELGTERFNAAMQAYYQTWKFKHPSPLDFKKSIEQSSGRNLDSIFNLLDRTGTLPNQQSSGMSLIALPGLKKLKQYATHPVKNVVFIAPAIGANSYDKLMLGATITNMKLPPSRFQFLATPMYGTGSGNFTGLGFLAYSFYPGHLFQSIDVGTGFARFSMNELTDGAGKKTVLAFNKFTPGIKLTFKNKNARSEFNNFIQFRSFILKEDGINFYRDTLVNGLDTTIRNRFSRRAQDATTLNQLRFVVENNRVLYPYRGELKIEQGRYFVRAGFTGNYFFNYPKGGGLQARLFAGKFIYTGAKTVSRQFATDRYHLNMTGPNGYEDYTYSDYFMGRNRFEGLLSQQIMMRDGAFKVRTDLLADKVAKTDDWLAAINLSSTIPNGINPLSILPVKIPLKVFVDIGTYAEAWREESNLDRFIFDAGIQVPLLKELVNIYIPLVYSSIYGDYYKSTILKKERFLKKISFTIDISNFSFRKIDRNLNF